VTIPPILARWSGTRFRRPARFLHSCSSRAARHLRSKGSAQIARATRAYFKMSRSRSSGSESRACRQDCEKFYQLFVDARTSFMQNDASKVFDLSMVFLGIRNFATCFSLGCLQKPDFSRQSALRLGTRSLPIAAEPYAVFERARILSTRGQGPIITDREAARAAQEFPVIEEWITCLLSAGTHQWTMNSTTGSQRKERFCRLSTGILGQSRRYLACRANRSTDGSPSTASI
jgi:hypothetical protein